MSWAFQKSTSGASEGLGGKEAFGSLIKMNSAQHLSAIGSKKKDVTVVIHICSEVKVYRQ